MRVVLDTNVVVSGILWSGVPREILRLWNTGRFEILASSNIFAEYQEVLARLSARYKIEAAGDILDAMLIGAQFLEPIHIRTPFCEDPDDIMFLELAIAGQADYLVSGDKHLLKVAQYPGGIVLKPAQFVSIFSK